MADRVARSMVAALKQQISPPPANAVKKRYSLNTSVQQHSVQNNAGDMAQYATNVSVSNTYAEPNVISASGPGSAFRPIMVYNITPADLATIGITPSDTSPPLVSTSAGFVKATLKNTNAPVVHLGLHYGGSLTSGQAFATATTVLFSGTTAVPVASYLGAGDNTTFAHTARSVDDGTTVATIHEGIPLRATYGGLALVGIQLVIVGAVIAKDGVTQTYFETCRMAVIKGNTLDAAKTYLNKPEDDILIVHELNLDSSLQQKVNSGTAGTLNVASADKIVLIGDSFSSCHYAIQGKAYIHTLSMLSDYNWENFSRSGYNAEQLKNAIRNNNKWYHASLGFKDYGSVRYAVIITNENDIWYTQQNFDMYIDNLRGLIEVVKATGAVPILCTEFYSGATSRGDYRALKALRALADRYGIMVIDLTTKTKLWNQSTYAPFWGNGHPGTRSTHQFADGMRRHLDTLPRPRQSLKLFRQRTSYVVGAVADLMFDTILDRATRFKELMSGHFGLTAASQAYYDALDQQFANQQYNSEYLQLQNGEAVAFPAYGLVEAVLPCTARTLTSLSLTLSDPAITVYVRHEATPPYESDLKYQAFVATGTPAFTIGDTYTSNDAALSGVTLTVYQLQANGLVLFSRSTGSPSLNLGAGTLTLATGTGTASVSYTSSTVGLDQSYYDQLYKPVGKWVQLAGSSGTYIVSAVDFKNVMNYDKVSFLLYKAGGFSLTSASVTWGGKEDKVYPSAAPLKESTSTELLAKPFVDATSLVSWTTTGTVAAISTVDGMYPYGVTKVVELDNANSIAQAVTVTANNESVQEIQIKVWARRFPAVFNPADPWSGAPVTEDTYDLATLVVDATEAGDTTSHYTARYKHTVGLHWKEVIFNVPITSFSTGATLKLYSADGTKIQIARVSAKLA